MSNTYCSVSEQTRFLVRLAKDLESRKLSRSRNRSRATLVIDHDYETTSDMEEISQLVQHMPHNKSVSLPVKPQGGSAPVSDENIENSKVSGEDEVKESREVLDPPVDVASKQGKVACHTCRNSKPLVTVTRDELSKLTTVMSGYFKEATATIKKLQGPLEDVLKGTFEGMEGLHLIIFITSQWADQLARLIKELTDPQVFQGGESTAKITQESLEKLDAVCTQYNRTIVRTRDHYQNLPGMALYHASASDSVDEIAQLLRELRKRAKN